MKSIDLSSTGLNGPTPTDPEAYYPTAHITVPEEKGELDMPEEGTVTFKYKLKRETTIKRGDKTVCEYDLDLISLEGYKGESDERPSKRDTSTEDALDKLAAEKSKSKKESDNEEGY